MLCEKGYIVPTGKQRTHVGRKPFQLDINPNDYFIIGVDLNIAGPVSYTHLDVYKRQPGPSATPSGTARVG